MAALIHWLSVQFSLSGPFGYLVEKGWVPQEAAQFVDTTFFAPLNIAANNLDWVRQQMSLIAEAWQQLPF